MIRTDGAPDVGAVAQAASLSSSSAQGATRPQPFGDFSAFHASPQASLGQTTASADPAHAARAVASFLIEA